MCSFRFTISRHYRKELERQLRGAQQVGQLARVKYLLAILAVMDDQPTDQVAQCLRIHVKTRAEWVRLFCVYGVQGAPRKKPTGRPPKLTATQKEALARLIEAGPQAAVFSAACWRSPLVQELILTRFGRYYSVFYLAQLLRNWGLFVAESGLRVGAPGRGKTPRVVSLHLAQSCAPGAATRGLVVVWR